MTATPALHPHNPEAYPDTAPTSPSGEAMPEFGVKRPLESVPCSPEFDRNEKRTYGGVEAGDIQTKTFEPAPAQFGEIWPPVPVPDMAEAPVTVTAEYASEAKAALKADPNEAVIGVVYIVDETTRNDFRNDGTWWRLAGQYARTEHGLVYKVALTKKPVIPEFSKKISGTPRHGREVKDRFAPSFREIPYQVRDDREVCEMAGRCGG